MKTIKYLLLTVISILLLSCSRNDDENQTAFNAEYMATMLEAGQYLDQMPDSAIKTMYPLHIWQLH